MLQKHYYTICIFFLGVICFGQTATISGTIRDDDGVSIPDVQIAVLEDGSYATSSDANGHYTLIVPADKDITISAYNISYKQVNQKFKLKSGEKVSYNPRLAVKNTITQVDVVYEKNRNQEIQRIDPKNFIYIPSPSGNLEDLIKTQIGVSSNNELSSGYSVRGGNFDENLVYVNDIEVYRPFLARSGQQEGLSFANPDMVSNINFSAGGFEAKYGDKMSSVLDITYKKPLKFGGTVSGSLLGGSLHVQGVSKNRVFAWSIGSRYKSNAYLLKSMDTKGEYRPRFYDVQTFLTFTLNEKWSIEFLGNVANNQYLVIPANRETTFGTVNNAIKLSIYFDGQELTQYNTMMGGLSTTFKPNSRTKLKLITSAYKAQEEEKYTVQGQYYIDQLEADFGKDNFGQVAFNRGVGTFLNNGRNRIDANVFNIEHKGTRQVGRSSELLWGIRYQHEIIHDKLSEWRTIDSAGYVSPYNPTEINLIDVLKTKINLETNRVQGYVQYIYSKQLRDSSTFTATGGIRANYWDFNKQTVVSPRVTLSYKPNWTRDILFKASWGYYYQPPFYREMRGFDGQLNPNIRAQQSIHYLLSGDYNFKLWRRPFKVILAGYYKEMKDLIPYEIDNTRIRYFATNNSVGYTEGIDLRINGEFVKGIESWATIGVLKTMENISNDRRVTYFNSDGDSIVKGLTFNNKPVDSLVVYPGYIPRPTDQRVTFGMFFQDYIPKLPSCKMYLNMQFGTGLPFGPPGHERWKQVLRMPPYRRVDIGFAYQIIKEDKPLPKKNPFHQLKGMFISIEVFNLLQVNNTVSYTWVTDVTNRQYAVPNYLTRRTLNLKLQVKF
ncbi:MAG: TonB-dependent receptor [Bacteroidetes bacterium]|nr:TonB-dependent receptor [Bacteroidota bacterium]